MTQLALEPETFQHVQAPASIHIGEVYQSLWIQYLDAEHAYASAMQRLCDEERACLTTDKEWRCAFKLSPRELEKTATGIVNHLIYEASERFAPPGSARLALPEDTIEHEFLSPLRNQDPPDWTSFNPSQLWDTLTQRYGGTHGTQLGYAQAAHGLARYFDIRSTTPLVTNSGRATLAVSVWMDNFDKKYGQTKLSMSCRDNLLKAITHMKTFLAWVNNGRPQTTGNAAHDHALNDLTQYRREIRSHEKIHCSDDWEIVTYRSKFEWRLSPRLTRLFQVFLSTYADLNTTEP